MGWVSEARESGYGPGHTLGKHRPEQPDGGTLRGVRKRGRDRVRIELSGACEQSLGLSRIALPEPGSRRACKRPPDQGTTSGRQGLASFEHRESAYEHLHERAADAFGVAADAAMATAVGRKHDRQSREARRRVRPDGQPDREVILLARPQRLVETADRPESVNRKQRRGSPGAAIDHRADRIVIDALPASDAFRAVVVDDPRISDRDPAGPGDESQLCRDAIELKQIVGVEELDPAPPGSLDAPVARRVAPRFGPCRAMIRAP